ncbi:hypothetical protein DPMN_133120 [Dreissena polymorpha]|uniref:Uncharacterized protein n=1 Tax=Dreissena polymorpha TaxID=45954 RepID=A0A9D4JDP9_DREPO|nr:hypothetical protein DPMN_133120 [Dreissena polymorpha]
MSCRNDSVTGQICKSDADCGNFKGTVCRGPANHSTCACRDSRQMIHLYTFECVEHEDTDLLYIGCENDSDCTIAQTCEKLYVGFRLCMNESFNNHTGDYYKKCAGDWDCSDPYKCIESYCGCPATTYHTGFDCRNEGDTGILCQSDADCVFYNGTACIGTADRSTCACPYPWQFMNTHTFTCMDRGLHHSCETDTHCSMGMKCEFFYGQYKSCEYDSFNNGNGN